jgi:hypothetical protein
LRLAEELAARPDEASQRTAISRAYYFVFNLAFARAESTAGHCPVNEGRHAWCWNKYMQSPDSDCKQLGSDGDRMKRRRADADYVQSTKVNLEGEVRLMLIEARKFEARLAALPGRFPRP